MFALPTTLVSASQKAGIETPTDPLEYDESKYVKFHLFCCAQLGAPMPYPGVHFENAEVIAKLNEETLETITMSELEEAGFRVGYS